MAKAIAYEMLSQFRVEAVFSVATPSCYTSSQEFPMGDRGFGAMQSLRSEELLGPLNSVEAKHAPAVLFIQGDPRIVFAGPRVALIGARKASEDALKRAGRLARELVANGVTIVSGLAEGIDTAAHRAAIEHRGKTIAVIGTPLDIAFPSKNRDLQSFIAREHLVVTQFPLGYPTRRGNFPLRNRTMALISHASVIVEASETSGSLSQGWEALRLGRPLFLLRSLVENPNLVWPKAMLEYGASVLSETDDLLESIPSLGLVPDLHAAI